MPSPFDPLFEVIEQQKSAIDKMLPIIAEMTERIDESATKEEAVGKAVEHWIDEAQNMSLSEAARITYLECAETVTKIFATPDAEDGEQKA